MSRSRFWQTIILAAPLACLTPAASADEQLKTISLSAADHAAASLASNFASHALGLATVNRQLLWATGRPANNAAPLAANAPIQTPGFFPGDLSNPNSGMTVQSAHSHDIYVNGLPSVWGTPANFLSDLNQSQMMHITDQYVNAFGANRYPVGPGGLLSAPLPHIIYDETVIAIAYLAGATFGTGYDHIYHIFLPPGQDVCFTAAPTECYSPDNFNTFFFCAYHASVDFPDIGHVLLTLEPYQNVPGCQVQSPSPNGPVLDSTADTLSHELFETITDPDGVSWWNHYSLPLFGAEIGDECQNFNFGYPSVALNGKKYEIQPEYSNLVKACVYSPIGLVWP